MPTRWRQTIAATLDRDHLSVILSSRNCHPELLRGTSWCRCVTTPRSLGVPRNDIRMTTHAPLLADHTPAEVDARHGDRLTATTYALIALGLVARLVQYLWRRSYWHDEAYQVLNVMTLTYRQLAGPLPHAQSAPPLFLVAQKALFDALGGSE